MKEGFLYVAFGKRYLQEAEISARSLKRFTNLPICLITDEEGYGSEYVDIVLIEKGERDFVSKIIGMQRTPFERTIFLDSDTFICSSIDKLFEVLDLFDMLLSPERILHSYNFFSQYNPDFKIKYESVLPEYN